MRSSLIAALVFLNSLAIGSVAPIAGSSATLEASSHEASVQPFPSGLFSNFPLTRGHLDNSTVAFGFAERARASDSEKVWRINFQPNPSCLFCLRRVGVPTEYVADIGAPYDSEVGYGWVTEESAGSEAPVPLDISGTAAAKNLKRIDLRLRTLLYMDRPNSAAAWEIDLENGDYVVTVGVGEGDAKLSDSKHVINIEGLPFIEPFIQDAIHPFEFATGVVTVSDGRLTVDSIGGENTKINFIEIKPSPYSSESPTIIGSSPQSREAGVNVASAINLDLALTVTGIDSDTINADTVRVFRTSDGELVEGLANTSGGGETQLCFSPLESSTETPITPFK